MRTILQGKTALVTVLSLALAMLLAATAFSAVPQTVNFQGYLTDTAGVPRDGAHTMTFKIYNDPTSVNPANLLWTEGSLGSVTVTKGVYNVTLGSPTAFPANMFDTNPDLYLEITVNGEVMDPRVKLDSSGFAIKTGKSDDADTVDGSHASAFATAGHDHDSTYVNEGQADSITTAMIQDSAVTDDKIATVSGSKVSGNISGNAATATALAADPTACANSFVTDISANGTLTCSSDGSILQNVAATSLEGQDLAALDSRYQHSVLNYPSTTAGTNANNTAITAGYGSIAPASLLVSGNPLIVYSDAISDKLVAVQCANSTCVPPHSAETEIAVAPNKPWSDISQGPYGQPAIAYSNGTSVHLVRCNASDCTSFAPDRTIGSTIFPANWAPSVAVNPSDYPVVSFVNSSNSMSLYVCSDSTCSAGNLRNPDGTTGCKDTAVGIGTNTYPFVVYSAGYDIKLYQCLNEDCSSGNVNSIYSGSAAVYGIEMSLASDGNPVIYSLDWNGSGSLIKCTNANCTASVVTADILESSMIAMTLMPGDIPFFAFHDDVHGGLNTYKCANTSCNPMNEGIRSSVDTNNDPGWFPSVGLNASGVPVIVHLNTDYDELRVTACGDSSCLGNQTAGVFAGNVMIYGDIVGTANFIGDGSQLTNLQYFANDSVTTDKIFNGTIVNADISASAAIADTKLATISTAGKVADTALSSNIPRLNSSNTFTQQNTFSLTQASTGAAVGTNDSNGGWGLQGTSSGSTGRGVQGTASGASGIGLYGDATTTGPSMSHGVFANSASQFGRGVTGLATNTSANGNVGGYFETFGTASTSYGVHAKAPSTGYAGYFDNRILVSNGGSSNLTITDSEISRTSAITIDAVNTTADSTVYIKNSNATYRTKLNVEGDIIVNSGASTDLTISETSITRSGDFSINSMGSATTTVSIENTLAGVANLSVEGGVNASGYNYQSAQSHSYRIPPQIFKADNAAWFCNDTYCYMNAGTTANAYAPVHLPQNATLTSYNCEIMDNDPSNNMQQVNFLLYARPAGNLSASAVGNAINTSTAGANFSITITNSTAFSETVSEDNYYIAKLLLLANPATSSNLRFYGCTVNYSMTELLP